MTDASSLTRRTLAVAATTLPALPFPAIARAATTQSAIESVPGLPLGIGWFFLYGYFGVPAAEYMPVLRQVGGQATKVYLFWQQIEPERGKFDWTAVDAFANQLKSPEEGLIALFASSTWAGDKPSALLPPGPARNLQDYYDVVHAMVTRCKGKVRFWQNDCEPNNPIYWSGSREQFTEHLKTFYRAVKDADPHAMVLCGGYDGLFTPPGVQGHVFPGQEQSLAFYDYVLEHGSDAFDLFDLRLYTDPYTIQVRVDYIRQRMRAFGYQKPIVCTEYGGPNFFEMPENRQYFAIVQGWMQATAAGKPAAQASGPSAIDQLYATEASLPGPTRMFLLDAPEELDAKYQRIQSRGIVIRNVLAFAAGVAKTYYWDLLAAPGSRNDAMTLMYGKIGLVGVADGGLKRITLSADVFTRMSAALAGVRAVRHVEISGQPDVFVFEVDRGARGPMLVAWSKGDAFTGEDQPPVTASLPWRAKHATAVDIFGKPVEVTVSAKGLSATLSVTPIYLT
jgi:hypothetical protein